MASSTTLPISPPLTQDPSQALLSHKKPESLKPTTTLIFISLLLITCIALSSSIAFAFLFFSGSGSHISSVSHTPIIQHKIRPLQTLKKPVIILISSDGFRFGYQYKAPTPNIHRLIKNGTEAETGLIPVFPTLTFPNHYAIATGLYPESHGVINNRFTDPVSGEVFTMQSKEPKWWLGEPIWETIVNHGGIAATYFWPGSEVNKGSWNCDGGKYCKNYNSSVPFEHRVDTVLEYFDLPSEEMPDLITLYFEDPDHQGHQVGPDDPEITKAVEHIDSLIGRLIKGLEKRGVFEDVSVIMLGDHGMVGTCDKKLVFLDDLAQWVKIPKEWVQSYSPVLSITPPEGVDHSDVVAKMNEGLSSGKVNNGMTLKVYLKEDLPKRLHYASSYRIPPIVGMVGEGYYVEQMNMKRQECGGAHGYDNAFFSMRTIFIGHGPQFARGRKVPSFENVQIYNLLTSILKIKGAPNNGTSSFVDSVLLSEAH
ncbi:hypothetical protein MKW94_015803 [Papaver nudicaule]|uniref:Uncharacterized protein n=1 Tax=Papaver nudicaule TaxID=74823 RepID=A0AA42B4F7_PAPNU|nr:hypothetical protein [Papaver nudicaule]